MNVVDRRLFLEAAHAYAKALHPTPQLVAMLCDTLGRVLAHDLEGRVTITLPGDIRIIREDKPS